MDCHITGANDGDLTTEELKQLRGVQQVEGKLALASGPWATSLQWAQRAGLVRLPMVSTAYCEPRLTDAGQAALIQPEPPAS